MSDGYGNDMPSWALAPRETRDTSPAWMMARHLRLDHGMALHKIAKLTGLSYKEVRLRLREDK